MTMIQTGNHQVYRNVNAGKSVDDQYHLITKRININAKEIQNKKMKI